MGQIKYHFIYRTVNTKTGLSYIGMHSTTNLNDGYLGSGVLLYDAIERLGGDSFITGILQFYDNRSELPEAEIYWVKKFNTIHPNGYNLTKGGGCWPEQTEEVRKKKSISGTGKQRSEQTKLRLKKV